MRITLDALLVLDAVDRAGSFAGGAEQLFRVPSAVSYTIRKLEQDLGILIFDRSGHRAKLTEAGAQLLSDARDLLRLAEELERKAKEVGAGQETRLSIAVGDVVPRSAIFPLLSAFYEAPGHEATRLEITREAQTGCWEALLAGRSDLVIGGPEPWPTIDGCRTQPLGEVEFTLVVPRLHPLADAEEPLPIDVCAPYRVVRQLACPLRDQTGCPSAELVTVDDYDSQLEAIRHGVGIGFMPAYLIRADVATGRLVTKTVAKAPRLRLAAAWCPTRATRGIDWFLERLRDEHVCATMVPRSDQACAP